MLGVMTLIAFAALSVFELTWMPLVVLRLRPVVAEGPAARTGRLPVDWMRTFLATACGRGDGESHLP